MNSTRNIETFTGDSIYSFELIPYLILNAVEIVVGAIGNILLFVGILCTKKLKSDVSNIIILSMTICHFYSSVVIGIFAQIGVIFGEEFFSKITGFCIFIGSTCVVACQNGFFNFVLLTFNRYIFTCYPHLYTKLFTKNKIIIFCLLTYLFFFMINTGHQLRDKGYLFDKQMNACIFNRKMNRIVLIIVLSVLMLPLIAMLYFYFAIFMAIKYAVEMDTVGSYEVNEEIDSENKKNLDCLRQTLQFSKGLIVMYIMYTFTIIPLCLVLIIDKDQEWPAYFHIYPWMFFRLCSAATPVVYPLFHPSIRFGYKNAFDRYVLRKKKLLIKSKPRPIHLRKKRMVTKL